MKKRHPVEVILIAFMIAGLLCQPLPLLANPVGGNVVGGSATIIGGPGRLVIHQSSHRAIINWNDFSIAAGEITKFVQPSASASVLNRVVGMNPTKIFGTLEANGHVSIINENGVLVGSSGVVNTRSFLASTLDVTDSGFLNGESMRFSGQSSAGIINAGRITALGGDVIFISRTIQNSGRISASQGMVGMAAGSEVLLQPVGSERIAIVAGKAGGGTGIDNSGTIQAVNAELKAAGGNVYALAINNGGVIRATGFGRDTRGNLVLRSDGGNIHNSGILAANNENGGGGSVVVDGGHNAEAPATVINEGQILARGDARGTEGGAVTMTGDFVGLFGRGLIDVSGHSGGGIALVGGGYQGADADVQNALRTIVAPEASIKADALSRGNGGKIVVWSDEISGVYGSLLARGGHGGFIETSSRGSLDLVGANVNAGIGGLWLLDPGNILIAAGGTPITPNVDFVVGAADADATVDPASIVSALNNNTSVKLSAAVTITVNGVITKTLNPNMTVPTLTLEAGDHIVIKENAIISSTAGALNLVLTADNDVAGLGNGTGTILLEEASGGGSPLPGRLDSNGGTINLHAADLNIQNDEGTIDSNDSQGNGGLITITASNHRSIGLGLDPGGAAMVIAGSELQRIISAGGLRLVTTKDLVTAGSIEVQGISGAESANVTGAVTLDSASTVSFVNNASVFNVLDARAVGDINVNQNLSTDVGTLTLHADSDNDGAGTLAVALLRTIDSNGSDLNITAASLTLAVTAAITSDGGDITITASDDQAIALGATTVAADFELTGANLQKFQTTGTGELHLVTTGSAGITVNGVTDAQSQDIAGRVLLDADGAIGFTGAASTFNILEAASDAGISLGVGVTTSGAQTYTGPVTLAADIGLAGSTVTFNNTVNATTAGAENLSITGNAVFGDGAGDFVGNTAELEFVTVSGTVRFNAGNSGASTVETAGNQTYGAATLGGDTLLTGGTIQFNSTVNAGTADADALNIAGAAVFGAAVGAVRLESVVVSGTATVNGSVNTALGQSYGGALTLGSDTVLTGTTLSLSVGGVSGAAHDLTLNFSGNTTINGGLLNNIQDLSIGGGGNTIISAGTIQTTGTQTYNDAVILAGDVALNAGGTVTFTETVNGTTAGQESLAITGNAVFGNSANDLVGNGISLEFLTVSGTTTFNAGNGSATVTTTGIQTYGGDVTLGADTTLVGSVVTFNDTVEGTSAGQQFLAITGNAVFGDGAGDFVGNSTALQSVNVSGTAVFNAGNSGGAANTVETTGTQTYGGAVTLGRDATLAGSAVQFNDTIDGSNPDAERLTITGNAVFGDGAGDFVGDLVGLRSVNVSGAATFNAGSSGASTIRTSEGQTYGSATLNGDTVLTATTVDFNGAVNGLNPGADSLLVVGNAVFDGTVNLESVGVTQTATVNGGTITTTLGQGYGALTLGDDTTLSGTTFGVTGGVNGMNHDLTLDFSGDTTIDGAVFSNVQDLSVGGGGNTIINGGLVQTTGTQTYDDAVRLSGDVSLTGTTVTFNGGVQGTTADQEGLAITGNAVFASQVGNGVRLQDVSVSGSTTFNVAGGGDTVTTVGTQTYGGAVTLSQNTILNGSTISFNNTVNGAQSLAIGGNAVFGNGAGDFVGSVNALSSLDVSGTTAFNGGNSGQNTVTTTGTQTYGGGVTLGADTTLQGTTIAFNAKVNGTGDGQEGLTITGNAVFGDGAGDFVGDLTRLDFVNVSGTTMLSAGNVGGNTIRTANSQTYGGAVTLGADTTLAGANVQFNGTVDGTTAGAETLTVVGNGVFGNGAADNVGGGTALESLAVTGTAAINGASVTTAGAQSYTGPVTVGTDSILSASALTFGSTVSAGANDLTAKANSITLGGAVTGSRVTLTSRNAGFDIGINEADDADSLGLSQAELGLVTANVLQIGDAAAGDITIAAATTINNPVLALVTGGRVTEMAGASLTVASLRIDAGGPVLLSGANSVTTLSGDFDGGLIFRDTAPLTVGNVDGKAGITSGGAVVLITDTLNIANAINAPGEIVTLQTLTAARAVSLGAENGAALSLTDQELDRISAALIRIGSEDQRAASITIAGNITLGANTTLSLRSEGDVKGDSSIDVGRLAIRSNGGVLNLEGQNSVLALAIQAPNALVPIFNNTVQADTTASIDGLAGVSGIAITIFNAASQGQASLSNVEIPLPRRFTVNFESGGVETVPTKVTPGSIWTSYLDVPFPKSDKADRAMRVEDASKFMSGSLAILGSTTGPQTGR